MVLGGYQTYWGDYFVGYTNVISQCCTFKTNVLYVNCNGKIKKILVKKKGSS